MMCNMYLRQESTLRPSAVGWVVDAGGQCWTRLIRMTRQEYGFILFACMESYRATGVVGTFMTVAAVSVAAVSVAAG